VQELIAIRWNRLDGLIGQSNGDLFRRFAQNITLRQLVVSANKHLQRLHKRYQLKPWNNMELVILDLDMGGEMRSTRSLSGGEGFLISMALALGLSDMASKDTRIGSLFIDEGFGTLDSETLQSVVSVLEELRLQGRMVGIISHVNGLAKQFGAVVQVKAIGDGRSQVKVMAAAEMQD
jgi:exonuclease SbcC